MPNNPDLPLTQSAASAAYGAILRHTESARGIEYRVFAERTAALEDAIRPDAPAATRVLALHDNRAFWNLLACDLASETNGLSDLLRANLLSLAIWVHRETSRAMHEGAPLNDLIGINRIVMQGLCPAPEEMAG
jgi:flagellar protein FlaF